MLIEWGALSTPVTVAKTNDLQDQRRGGRSEAVCLSLDGGRLAACLLWAPTKSNFFFFFFFFLLYKKNKITKQNTHQEALKQQLVLIGSEDLGWALGKMDEHDFQLDLQFSLVNNLHYGSKLSKESHYRETLVPLLLKRYLYFSAHWYQVLDKVLW